MSNSGGGLLSMSDISSDKQTFSSPFSAAYWRAAAAEVKNPRMLVMAAMIVALRVLLKSVELAVIPGVIYITFGFFANALGSMVYGPVLGLIGGAISDTLGAVIFPKGDYFLPFIITEMASSFIFALFLYRAKPTVLRILASRFSVVAVCNLILTPIIMKWDYAYFGIEKSYKLFSLARTIKNAALFPLEALLLVIFLRAVLPATNRIGLTHTGDTRLSVKAKDIAVIALMTAVAGVFVYLYYRYYISK